MLKNWQIFLHIPHYVFKKLFRETNIFYVVCKKLKFGVRDFLSAILRKPQEKIPVCP
jgi:hypothetical protein